MSEDGSRQDGYEWLRTHDPEAIEVLHELKKGCPELVDLLIKHLYEELYQRRGLDLKTRLLLTVACAASAGTMLPQVTYQSRLALLNGVKREELYEVLFHVAVFSGFAHAMNAMNAIKAAISTIPDDVNSQGFS
jgi:4-carboxymuconolactone decarboxylase